MEHLALEVFDRATKENPNPTGSQYAVLEPDATITITDTSEIFADGDVWSYDFTLNVHANAHLFGTAGDIHGSRLHEQINKRKARLWVEGVPLYLGYLKLGDEAEVDAEGNVDVSFGSGQKTFEEMIEGTSAQEVSVGDVVIGVALNRKRVSVIDSTTSVQFTLDGLEPFAAKDNRISPAARHTYSYGAKYENGTLTGKTPNVQRWPKLVKSCGEVLDSEGNTVSIPASYTNVQTPYDDAHPFCNINICYPLKVNDKGEEKAARGYTLRLAHSSADTTDGGDNETRFNNAPNFYLLYFIDRLFKDMNIHVAENQAKDVEDLRRVFMLNYGCHYEEIEDTYGQNEADSHETPAAKLERYGQYYMRIIRNDGKQTLLRNWDTAGQFCFGDARGLDHIGKVLLRNVTVKKNTTTILSKGSLEGFVQKLQIRINNVLNVYAQDKDAMKLDATNLEKPGGKDTGFYSAYLAYATGENYPHVEISEIIEAMKSMFGIRLIFNGDYTTVRIVLLRNIFRSGDIQDIDCDIVDEDEKVENNKRGFRMTYGKGKDDTSYFYKGFDDLFSRAYKTWKDTSDRHDYSQWKLNANYDEIKQEVSAFNRTCYVTSANGNAYGTQVDENEDVLFPSLFEWAGFMDAEDGDCSLSESEPETVEEIQCGATPVLMNDMDNTYASLFSGDLKAPSPEIKGSNDKEIWQCWSYVGWLATYGKITQASRQVSFSVGDLTVGGDLDIYIAEGFQMRMADNYAVSNGGTPFDEADPGLCFGIMRGSGSDAYVRYYDDPDDNEDGNGNDTWEIVPGSAAISHPDTCDDRGRLWDYNGSEVAVVDRTNAEETLTSLFPSTVRNAPFWASAKGYINGASIYYITGADGVTHRTMFAMSYSLSGRTTQLSNDWGLYMRHLSQSSDILAADATGYNGMQNLIIELDSSEERCSTLLRLCKMAYGSDTGTITIDNGVGSQSGRFSLKLRAEKLNPLFNPSEDEGPSNRRYLEIANEDLRQRGLCDQCYKEYSYWVRNARIVKRTVRMTLAQLQTIDKTKRVRVGDVTGFIRKMQYSVSNETGLGNVVMEIMYI